MDKEQAYQTAVDAVTALVKARGTDTKFPFDAIWQYNKKSVVPSLQRPALARRLQNAGFIERTGAWIKTESESRASTTGIEYRPGPIFASSAEKSSSKTKAPQSVAAALKAMATAMDERGFIVNPEQLTNYYLALLSSPMVIMTGTSGTGKSLLPRVFAELTGSGFSTVPVKPQWDDNSDMFGYTSPLQSAQFIQGEFTKAILAANAKQNAPYFVLLDEMNLAAVEHYFSDFLSVVETRRRDNNVVITDPLPLDLPVPPAQGSDLYSALRKLTLPPHVKVVGTANMDETTRTFSPKVLDRAFSIEFAEVDLSAFPVGASGKPNTTVFGILATRLADNQNPVNIVEAHSTHADVCEEAAAYLQTVRAILAPTGLSFAYRTRDAVCFYMSNWERDKLESVLPKDDALDYCILQKVLAKIYGQGELLAQTLNTLREWLEGKQVTGFDPCPGFPRSAAKLDRMIKRLDADGTTTYWGT